MKALMKDDLRSPLSEDQYNYGMEKIEILAEELDLTFEQTIRVVELSDKIRTSWNWVNMGRFLMIKANEKDGKNQVDIKEADELDALQAKQNKGRGISCVKSIIFQIRKNDYPTAKRVYQLEGDKIQQYSEIQEWLEKRFGCRTHLKKNCNNWLCKKNENICRHTNIRKNGTCEDCGIDIDHLT